MSDGTVRAAERLDLLTAETSEGAQELQRRTITTTDELGREVEHYCSAALQRVRL